MVIKQGVYKPYLVITLAFGFALAVNPRIIVKVSLAVKAKFGFELCFLSLLLSVSTIDI